MPCSYILTSCSSSSCKCIIPLYITLHCVNIASCTSSLALLAFPFGYCRRRIYTMHQYNNNDACSQYASLCKLSIPYTLTHVKTCNFECIYVQICISRCRLWPYRQRQASHAAALNKSSFHSSVRASSCCYCPRWRCICCLPFDREGLAVQQRDHSLL